MKDWKYVRKHVALLIDHLQNYDESAADNVSEKTIQYCLNCLKNHMFPFTDFNHVISTLHGLVEKFSIRNEPEIGIALQDRVENFLSLSKSFYKYDIVRLLFCLSNSPNAATFASTELNQFTKVKAPEPEEPIMFDRVDPEDEFIPSYSSTSSDECDEGTDKALETLDFVEYQKAITYKARLAASIQLAEPSKQNEFTFAEYVGILDSSTETPVEEIPCCSTFGESNPHSVLAHRIALVLSGIPSDLFTRQDDKFSVSGFIPDFNIPHRTLSSLLSKLCEVASDSIMLDNFCSRYAVDHIQQCLQSAGVFIRKLQQESRLKLLTFLQSNPNFNIFKLPQIVSNHLRHISYLIPIISQFTGECERSASESCALFLSECFKAIEISLLEHDVQRMHALSELFHAAVTPYVQCLHILLEQGYLPGSGYKQFMIDSTMETSGIRSFRLRDDSSVPEFLKQIALPVLQCVKTLHQLQFSKALEKTQNDCGLPTIFGERFHKALQATVFCPFTVIIQESVLMPVLERVKSVNQAIVNEFISKNRLRHYIQQIHDIYFMLKGHLFVDFILELSLQRARNSVETGCLSRLLRDQLYEYQIVESMKFTLKSNSASFPEIHFQFPFPLSLLLSEQNLTRYNAIFCLLIEVSCAKSTLESLMKFSVKRQEKRFLHIKWQISHFINTLHNYIRSQISRCCDEEFIAKLETSSSLEELLLAHDSFLDALHRDLLLKDSTKVVLAHIQNILSLSSKLSILCTRSEVDDDTTSLVKIASDFSSSNRFIMALLNQISLKSKTKTEFGYVLMRLNYNSFYEL